MSVDLRKSTNRNKDKELTPKQKISDFIMKCREVLRDEVPDDQPHKIILYIEDYTLYFDHEYKLVQHIIKNAITQNSVETYDYLKDHQDDLEYDLIRCSYDYDIYPGLIMNNKHKELHERQFLSKMVPHTTTNDSY